VRQHGNFELELAKFLKLVDDLIAGVMV